MKAKARKARRRKRQRNRRLARAVLGASGALLAVAVIAAVVQLIANWPASHRMEDFVDVPETVYEDLLYLTYLDSLRLDDLAVPSSPDTTTNVARLALVLAGVPQPSIEAWGFDHDDLRRLYAAAHGLGRMRPPGEAGVLKLLKEKELVPGHVILGQLYPYTNDGRLDFCALVTRGNAFAARQSTVLYCHEGRLVHGNIGDAPRFAYFGAVIPGHDLETAFRDHLLVRRRLK